MRTIQPLTKFYIAMSLSWLYFWIALAVPYLTSRGLTAAEAVGLIAIYNMFTVILEYPTGVFGDVYGYKLSVFLGNLFGIFAMIALAAPGNYSWYLLGLVLLALAVTFQSGSDMGMLKLLTPNIRKASGDYKFLTDFTLFVSAILGGLLAKIDFTFALYFNAFVWGIGAIAVLAIPLKQVKEGGSNIFATAMNGFHFARYSKPLLGLMLLATVLGAYAVNLKSLFGSFSELFNISVEKIGVLIGVSALLRAGGAKLFPRIEIPLTTIVFIVAGLTLLAATGEKVIVIGAMLSTQILNGYYMAKADAMTHELVSDRERASVFSLKKLVTRIFAAVYLALASYLLSQNAFSLMLLITAFLLCAIGIAYSQLNKNHELE